MTTEIAIAVGVLALVLLGAGWALAKRMFGPGAAPRLDDGADDSPATSSVRPAAAAAKKLSSAPPPAATAQDDEPPASEPPPRPSSPVPDELGALRKGLAVTRGGFVARLAAVFGRKPSLDPQVVEQMEEVLLGADIGVATSQRIVETLRTRLTSEPSADLNRVWGILQEEATAILSTGKSPPNLSHKPAVILIVGVNGVGKTTTIGKLASRYTKEGKSVLLAAGDTFRAAAVTQLEVWGRRAGIPVVVGAEKSDPGSVIFDAINRAKAEGKDLVIADTAGRLHTKVPLMDELKKVYRTVEKALGRPADEVWLVLDSTNGQNAIQQTKLFKETVPVSGIVLTKLDGTAKGGVILGIVAEHQVPVRFVGVGERVEDLREFDPNRFATALFEQPDTDQATANTAEAHPH